MEIFVVYSWINEEPDEKVLKLVASLRETHGYDAVCDIMVMQTETAINFNKMMAQCLREAEKVIVVLSEKYKKKADSFEGGVGVEYQYIIDDINTKTQKYILVTFDDDRDRVTPDFLHGREILFLDETEIVSNDLLLKLEGKPGIIFPEVNPKKTIPVSREIGVGRPGKKKRMAQIINLPHSINPYFTGRTEILQSIYENFHDESDITRLKRVQSIRGLGGIGKTSIVLQYAYAHRLEYQTIWWVNAESQNSALSSYRNFCLRLQLVSEDDKDDVVIREMQKWFFDNEEWLFIFDNADAADYDSWLESYLPLERNGHILITTRNYTFLKSKALDILVLNETEALSFIKLRTDKVGEGYSDDSARELARLLGYLPLALEQAGAYVYETPGVTYRHYINLLAQYGIDVFNAENSLVDYTSTVTATWKISIAKISNESSVKLFNMCANMAPDAIPVEMFVRGAEVLPKPLQSAICDNLQRDAILTDLRRYSLLQCERDESVPGDEKRLLYIHRLVQEVVQKSFGEDSSWLAYCLDLIKRTFNWQSGDKGLKDTFRTESPHVIKVAEKAYKVFAEDHEKLEAVSGIFYGSSIIHGKMLYLDAAKSYSDRCIGLFERFYGETKIAGNNLFMAYMNRGSIYTLMLAYDKAVADFDRSIAIGEQLQIDGILHFRSELASAYMKRGIAYEYMKLHDKALSDKNRSIEMSERLYRADLLYDGNELALAYINRAVTHESMMKYDESLSDINKGIEIWEKLKNEGKAVNENDLANAYINRSIVGTKTTFEKNKGEDLRKANEGAEKYNRSSSAALLNYRKKQMKQGRE